MTRQWLRAHVQVEGECWLWPNDGLYRRVYAELVGTIIEGAHIHHVCQNRRCVRPSHLKQYTKQGHANLHGPKQPIRLSVPEDVKEWKRRRYLSSYSPQWNGVVSVRR